MITGLIIGAVAAGLVGVINGLLGLPPAIGAVGGGAACLGITVGCMAIGLP